MKENGNDSALVRCPVSSVIASGAKQSPRVFKGQPGDCFVAALLAMTCVAIWLKVTSFRRRPMRIDLKVLADNRDGLLSAGTAVGLRLGRDV